MRMDPTRGETVLELIERIDQTELADLIFQLGDERCSRRIATCIKQDAAEGKLVTTLDLRRSVIRAVGPARVNNIDPATRTFQALRIAVNSELEELASLMGGLHEMVRASGVVALISFHSLEDRLVKRGLAERALWRRAGSKPLVPGNAELSSNPRSRSAKLRVATRTAMMQVPAPIPEGVDPGAIGHESQTQSLLGVVGDGGLGHHRCVYRSLGHPGESRRTRLRVGS